MTRPLSGLVLAGGASRRMGTDKALLQIDGVRLVDRVVARLGAVADDVTVASGQRDIPGLEVPQVRDEVADAGPLAGLAAGLTSARHPLVAVLACDLSHPDTGLLRGLADRWDGEVALIPSYDGRPQPLHALWTASAAGPLAELLLSGIRALMAAADRVGAVILDEATSAALATDPRWATNLNSPADL